MSDGEKVEVRHVTKEPEIKDLENIKRITKKLVSRVKKDMYGRGDEPDDRRKIENECGGQSAGKVE